MQLRRFPDDVLATIRELSDKVVAEIADKDPLSRKVYESFLSFRSEAVAWHDISERAYLNARGS